MSPVRRFACCTGQISKCAALRAALDKYPSAPLCVLHWTNIQVRRFACCTGQISKCAALRAALDKYPSAPLCVLHWTNIQVRRFACCTGQISKCAISRAALDRYPSAPLCVLHWTISKQEDPGGSTPLGKAILDFRFMIYDVYMARRRTRQSKIVNRKSSITCPLIMRLTRLPVRHYRSPSCQNCEL